MVQRQTVRRRRTPHAPAGEEVTIRRYYTCRDRAVSVMAAGGSAMVRCPDGDHRAGRHGEQEINVTGGRQGIEVQFTAGINFSLVIRART